MSNTVNVDSSECLSTLALITNDEAEFWTSSVPLKKPVSSSSKVEDSGLYFRSEIGSKKMKNDRLFVLYHEGIERAAKEASLEAEKRELSEIFEFGVNCGPGVNPSVLSRFFSSPLSSSIQSEEEEFTEIDEKEVTSVINGHHQSMETKEKKKNWWIDVPSLDDIRSFFRELSEEMEVIRGMTDEETLFERRRQRRRGENAKNSNIEPMDFF